MNKIQIIREKRKVIIILLDIFEQVVVNVDLHTRQLLQIAPEAN